MSNNFIGPIKPDMNMSYRDYLQKINGVKFKKTDLNLQVMLSEVFDKVFYKTYNSKLCKYCGGDGQIEVEEYFPRGFNNDIGIVGTKFIECDECKGTGKEEE